MASPEPAPTGDMSYEEATQRAAHPRAIQGQLAIDGLSINGGYVLNFSGSVELNIENPGDKKLIDDLLLGRSVEIPTSFYVLATGGRAPRDKEGEVKSVRKGVSLKAHSVNPKGLKILSTP